MMRMSEGCKGLGISGSYPSNLVRVGKQALILVMSALIAVAPLGQNQLDYRGSVLVACMMVAALSGVAAMGGTFKTKHISII